MAMTADETKQRAQDEEERVRSYKGIMTAATHYGVPFSLGFGVFFTVLTMRAGMGAAFVSAIAVYLFAWWIVRTFFSSH